MKEVFLFWPQIGLLLQQTIYIFRHYLLSGTIVKRKVNFVTAFQGIILELIFVIYGGFFYIWKAPQFIYIILASISIFVIFVAIRFLIKEEKYDTTIESTVTPVTWTDFVVFVLMYWGGFFDGLIEFINK